MAQKKGKSPTIPIMANGIKLTTGFYLIKNTKTNKVNVMSLILEEDVVYFHERVQKLKVSDITMSEKFNQIQVISELIVKSEKK